MSTTQNHFPDEPPDQATTPSVDRLRGRTVGEVAEEQYGFTPDKDTTIVVFVLEMLAERAVEMQKDV